MYLDAAYVIIWFIFGCGLYQNIYFIRMRLILGCGLYHNAAYSMCFTVGNRACINKCQAGDGGPAHSGMPTTF